MPLSYRALAPGGAGFCYRICTGTSESRPTAHYSLLTANSSYTFSAKEKDSETGLSYFGSRYYSSDLSIWLSVDPMSDKYPSLSPYTYCTDNPVKLVDPNGEDYEVLIDNSNKTITIKATYYVTKDTKEGMEMGFRYFTLQQQNLSYTMEDGESYSIKFDLSIAGEYNTWQEAGIVTDEANNGLRKRFEMQFIGYRGKFPPRTIADLIEILEESSRKYKERKNYGRNHQYKIG